MSKNIYVLEKWSDADGDWITQKTTIGGTIVALFEEKFTCHQCNQTVGKLFDYGGGIHLCQSCYDADIEFENAHSDQERRRGY